MPFPDVIEMPMFVAADGTPAIVAVRLINFDTGRSELKPGHQQWIAKVGAEAVISSPNSWVNIHGYASKLGNPQANLVLSQQRAESVRLELGTQVSIRGGIFGNRVTIERGFGEDHPAYQASEGDDSPNWRAAEVFIFGKKPGQVHPPKKNPQANSTKDFEIRILDSIGAPIPGAEVSADLYRFEIKDIQRRERATFIHVGGNVGFTLEAITGALNVQWGSGPPSRFRTNKPINLFEFDGTRTGIQVDPGYSGAFSVGGAVKLKFEQLISKYSGGILVSPNPIEMQSGAGISPASAGSSGHGYFKMFSNIEKY
ncbi:MAG: OmpA family protein [Acidobacteriota bacterium]